MAIQKITAKIIADGAIVAADVADGSITNAKIDSVANTKITGLITSAQIANVANTQVTGSIEATQVGTTVSQLFGMRNRIINGDMVIDQRNAGASVTGNNGTFSVDRWFADTSASSKFTMQQNAGSVTPPIGFTNYLGVTSSSAYSVTSGDYFLLEQRIEGLNIADLGWGTANAQTVTLSFRVRSSLTGTFGGALGNNGNNQSYPFSYTISSANTWTTVSITIPGATSGTWLTTNGTGIKVFFGLGVGSSYSGTAGAWSGSLLLSATGATSVVGTNGATFYITGVQLEVGSTATPFERRLYGQELANCQRYYWKLKANNTISLFANGVNTSTTASRHLMTFPVPMRTNPSSLETSGTASDYRLWNGTTTTNLSAVPVLDTTTEYNANLSLTVASGLTANAYTILIANTGTAAYLGWSAEL